MASNPSILFKLSNNLLTQVFILSKIDGIVATKSLIWCVNTGIIEQTNITKKPIKITYTIVVPRLLLIPFFCIFFTIGANNQAKNKPINKGANVFNITKMILFKFNSWHTLIIKKIAPMIIKT